MYIRAFVTNPLDCFRWHLRVDKYRQCSLSSTVERFGRNGKQCDMLNIMSAGI